jgi:hypothetical protein
MMPGWLGVQVQQTPTPGQSPDERLSGSLIGSGSSTTIIETVGDGSLQPIMFSANTLATTVLPGSKYLLAVVSVVHE